MLTSDFFDALDLIISVSSSIDAGDDEVNARARALAAAALSYIDAHVNLIISDADRQSIDDV